MLSTLMFFALWIGGIKFSIPSINDIGFWIFTAICLYGALHN